MVLLLPKALAGNVAAITRKGVQDRDVAAVGGRSDRWTSCLLNEIRDTPAAVVLISRGSYEKNANRNSQTPRVSTTKT